MKRIVLSVAVTVQSPFLFPDTVAGSFGLDRVALRDATDRAILPQDQLRGVLFHACADAAAAMNLARDIRLAIFGRPSAEARSDDPGEGPAPVDFEPARGRILFGDLVAERPGKGLRSMRVHIDPDTGAAEEGKLIFAELIAPPGAAVTFAGEAVLMATEAEAKVWLPLIEAAASWVSAIGAMKSAGFGEVTGFALRRVSDAPLPARPVAGVAERQGYHLRFDRRFLVDARRVADNIYVGQDVVPGAVIKGALARKLDLCGELAGLAHAVTDLSISHARRVGAGASVPASMVVARGPRTVGDALLVPPGKGAMMGGKPALFRGDWKPWAEDAVRRALGLGVPHAQPRSLRTHVSIDATTGTAADRKLYVIDAVEPAGALWSCVVDYGAIADAEARHRIAGALEGGLDGIGRTGAGLRLERVDAPPLPPIIPIAGKSDLFAVVLESDAVMASPQDGEEAFDAYRAWWARLLPGADMRGHFATQRLAGGYIARRFAAGAGYRPFWLTEAGSVFLLQGDISAALANLVRKRLPSPVIGGVTTDWRTCPYQPENGYGEIRCSHDGALTGQVTHA